MVADAVKGTVGWVMGDEGAKLPVAKKTAQPNLDVKVDSTKMIEKEDNFDISAGASHEGGEDHSEDLDGGDSTVEPEDVAADGAGWESGSISDNDFDRKIAAATDDAGEGESDLEISKRAKTSTTAKSKPELTVHPGKPNRTFVTSSTFLPSLSAGFTLGDSDSDPDLDPDVDDAGLVGNKTVRKNRRGQRARQA